MQATLLLIQSPLLVPSYTHLSTTCLLEPPPHIPHELASGMGLTLCNPQPQQVCLVIPE
jgi:hypothetical protein